MLTLKFSKYYKSTIILLSICDEFAYYVYINTKSCELHLSTIKSSKCVDPSSPRYPEKYAKPWWILLKRVNKVWAL